MRLDSIFAYRHFSCEVAVDTVSKHKLREQLIEACGTFNESADPADRATLIREIQSLRSRLRGAMG